MKERPILFSGAMVRALLNGSKTQTRRVIKVQPESRVGADGPEWWTGFMGWQHVEACVNRPLLKTHVCPYGQPGDRLWVRECFRKSERDGSFLYRADHEDNPGVMPWKPSIHMPRVASRILLEVVEVRAERLHAISKADCVAEGHPRAAEPFAEGVHLDAARDWYEDLWIGINGFESWKSNPWVWVLTFKVLP